MSATATDTTGCWQSVRCPDVTVCGSVRDGWYVLGPGNAQLARYGPELELRTASEALQRYRIDREEAKRHKEE